MNLIPLDDVEVEAEDAEASAEGFTLTPIEEEAEFTLTPIEEESVNPLKKDGIVDKVMERGAIGVAQGVYGLGRAAYGALGQEQQVLEDIGGKLDQIPGGKSASRIVPGLGAAIELAQSDVGENIKQYSQEVADIAGAQINEWQRKGEAVGGGLPGKVSQLVGSAAVSIAPAVVTAPFGGIPAAAITSGMQSFGSTSADAVDAYRNQGLSDEEARNKALIPSVASGIATAAITALGGKSGPEALAGLAKSSGFRRFAVDLLKGAGVEGGEETVDQLMQSAIQKLSFNPELTLQQALEDSAVSGLLGFGLGAGFKAVTQVSSPEEVKKQEFKAKIQNTVAQVEELAAAGLPQTAAVLAEQDKQKLILEAVEEATMQPEFLGALADEELIRRKEESSPEQARAIDEEINRRTQGEQDAPQTAEPTPSESIAETIDFDPSTAEGIPISSKISGRPEEQVTSTELGLPTAEEVSDGDDLLDLIKREPETEIATTTEQAPETTTGEDQPAPSSGTEVQPAGARVQNSPEVQNQLAEAIQPLKAQLIKRASDLGASDPEAAANDAILRSIKTAKDADEAGRIANSTGIQQAVADTLRKEGAEMRRAQAGAVSLEEEVSEGQRVADTIAEDVATPEQEVVKAEQREVFDNYRDEFFSTLTPAEKAIWNQIHNAGTGRAPRADKINQIAAKFSRFLKSKGMRDIRAVPAVRKAPKNWRPTSDKTRQRLVQKYKLDKGITEALKALGTNSENTYRALIAKFLSARVRSDLALVPKQYLGFRPYDGLFGYNGQLPAVLLNMSNLSNDTALEQIFLHETIHAMTTDLVDIYQESPNLLTPEQRKLIDGVNNLFEEARKQLIGDPTQIAETLKQAETDHGFYDVPANRAIYGLTDLGEFISEAMSNPEFQNLLKSVEVKTPRKTAWKELVHLIKRLLGVQSDSVALDRAIEDILSLVDEGKRFAQSQENVARGERQFKRSEIGKSKVTTQEENANVKTDEEVGAAPVVYKDSEASAREAREISLHLRGGGSTIDPATLSEPARRAQFYAQQANLLRWARDNGKLIQSPGIPTENLFAQGAEHQVYLNPDDPSTIIKRSIPGQFGASHPYIDELGTLQRTPAVPSDYFDRLETDNTILGDDRKFLGIEFYPDSTFSILTSQPQVTAESHKREGYTQYRERGNYIQGLNLDGKWELVSDEVLQNSYRDAKEEGNDALAQAILNQAGNVVEQASQEDIDQNFLNEGFKRLGTYTWLDPTGEMIIDDTHPRNFILMENGQIRPVDVNVRIPSERELGTLRRRFGRELPGPAMAPASPNMEPMGQPREVTTALGRARTGLPEEVSRKLSDQTYVPTTKAEEMAYADQQVDAWKAEGIGYEQMIARILSTPQAFDNLYTARQTAIASRIFRDLGREMAATTSVLQRQRLADLQYRLANGMASIGSSLGQGLWSFNQIADELAPVTIVKATKEAFKQKQDEMMPQSVKDTAKKVVKEVNEANKKAAGNETVQKKVKETADKVGKVDLSKTADRFLKDIEKKKKARELAAKNKEAAKFQKEGQPNKSKPETLKETYEDSYSRRVASAFINKILGADKTSVPSLELFYEELSKLAQSKLNAQLPKVEEAQKNDARFEEVVGILKNIFNNQAEYDSALTEIKDRVYREARNRGATEETLADIETYLDALQPETLTDSKLQRLLSDSIDFRELVQEHYTNLDEASITLTDKILSRTGMSFADASKIAIRIEKLVQDEAAKAKQSILERLLPKDKKTNKAVRNASQRIIQLSNLGALTEEAYYNAVAEKLKLPSFNKKLSDEIVRQANDIQLMEEGSNKRKLATQKLHSFIAKSAGLNWHSVVQGYWYAAILSGMGTQAFNVVSAALRVQTELAVQAAQTKSIQGFAQAYNGAFQGFMRAVSDSAAALTKGDYTGQPAFEPTKSARDLELITEADPKWMRVLSYGKYISRLMAAADILNAGVAKESRLRLAAYRSSFEGEPNLSLPERNKQIDELLGRTQEKRTEAEFQATEEGLNPGSTDFKRRVMEILDKLAPSDYVAESQRYAIEATYNQKPVGILGLMSEAIEKITSKGGGIGKYLIPFTRIVANVTNDQLNYTPIGLGRFAYSAIAKNQDQAKLRMLVSEDATEADIQLFRAKVLIGNSLMIGLAVALAAYDDDDDPALQIIAAGPKDPEKRKQFLAAGGQTYSIKVGDKYLSYLATPMAMSLAMLGSYKDSQRYTNMSDKDALDKFAIGMFGGLGLTLEMSFMRGMANLVEIFSQPFGPELGAKKAVDTILNIPAGLVPNIVKELEQVLQPQVPEKIDSADNLMSKLPGVRSVMAKKQPQLNMFGEPRKLPLPLIRRFVSEEKEGKAYEIARLLLNQNIAIPVPEKLRKPDTQKEYLDGRQLYKAREIVGKGLKKFLEDNYAELKKDAETNPELAQKKIDKYYEVLRDQAAINAIK